MIGETSPTDEMIPEFVAFVKALPFEFTGDAVEALADPRFSLEQREWLRDYIGRWEALEAVQS